jgi:sec-independent protein translocase protein TatB
LEAPQDDYKHPQKNWRLNRSAMPHWYKARQGVRTRALSGAARVARYRPQNSGSNTF